MLVISKQISTLNYRLAVQLQAPCSTNPIPGKHVMTDTGAVQ